MRIFDVGVIRMLAVGRWITEGETERFYTEMSGEERCLACPRRSGAKGGQVTMGEKRGVFLKLRAQMKWRV